MREYIECLRTLWTAATTQPVSYSGEFIQISDYLRLIPRPMTGSLFLQAERLMIQLAGSHADGLILGGLNTPKYITEVCIRISTGASSERDACGTTSNCVC
jgi:alkanesulfonate monooxygenase SsuD/methylene tetrahydromethanopterin reductase-like flavin-dependent oxidoreductase (luciferase family)